MQSKTGFLLSIMTLGKAQFDMANGIRNGTVKFQYR